MCACVGIPPVPSLNELPLVFSRARPLSRSKCGNSPSQAGRRRARFRHYSTILIFKSVARPDRVGRARVPSSSGPQPYAAGPVVSEGRPSARRGPGLEIQGPQCAFETSMFMCPAVHMSTRNLLRSSSTHEPSDPPFRVVCFIRHPRGSIGQVRALPRGRQWARDVRPLGRSRQTAPHRRRASLVRSRCRSSQRRDRWRPR